MLMRQNKDWVCMSTKLNLPAVDGGGGATEKEKIEL